MSEIKLELKAHLSKFLKNYQLKDDEDIFSTGFISSLFAMQLIMFIEKNFNVKVENKDLDLANFRTINSIVSFIHEKHNETTNLNEVNTN